MLFKKHISSAVSLPFLVIGYAAILASGVQHIRNWNAPAVPGFAVLFPIYCCGLILLWGYSQQVSGRLAWRKPLLFWSVSAAFNALPLAEHALEHWQKISVPAFGWSHPSFFHDLADTYRGVFHDWGADTHIADFDQISQFTVQGIYFLWMPLGCLLSILMLFFERSTRNASNVD